MPGIVSLLTTGRDTIQYKLTGSAGVRTPIGVIDLPMTHEDRLSLPGLPGFSVDGLSVRSVSFTDVAFDVKLRVKNPNTIRNASQPKIRPDAPMWLDSQRTPT